VLDIVLKDEHFQLAAILESNVVAYPAVEKPSDYPTVNASAFVLIFATSLCVVHVSPKTKIRGKPHSSSRGELPTLKTPPYGLYPTAIQSSY
jgi:hypothetical protein